MPIGQSRSAIESGDGGTMNTVRSRGRRLAAVTCGWLAAGLLAAGALGANAGTAHAATSGSYVNGFWVNWGTQAYWITASYDGQNVAVAEGSYSPDARIIQWNNDGTTEQKWYFDQVVYYYTGGVAGYMIRNENSGLCLSQDGSAGDGFVQETCNANQDEIFGRTSWGGSNYIYNVSTGLMLDVSGFSYSQGAAIDGWYQNDQGNQNFWVVPTSS
jgi:hypothetical protein